MVKRLHIGITEDVVFGDDVTVVEPVNLYGCEIGGGTFIGPFVEVQRDVRIGRKCRIQSHTMICSLVEMGDECFVGHGVMFVNDSFSHGGPARGDTSLYGRTVLGDNVTIGSNTTIMPVRICSGVVIGAGSVVTKDIEEPGFYCGNPARFLRAMDK